MKFVSFSIRTERFPSYRRFKKADEVKKKKILAGNTRFANTYNLQ